MQMLITIDLTEKELEKLSELTDIYITRLEDGSVHEGDVTYAISILIENS